MQIANRRPDGAPGGRALGRAIQYVMRYPRVTLVAIVSLLIATAAQLAVPQLIEDIIETITTNAASQAILDLPVEVQEPE